MFAYLTTFALLAAACFLPSEAEFLYDVSCQGESNELRCPEGEVIRLEDVNYGPPTPAICGARDQRVGHYSSGCLNHLTGIVFAIVCNEWEYCRIPGKHPLMLPCEENYFLEVAYSCHKLSKSSKTVTTCVGDTAKLTCDEGYIWIDRTNYGRLDTNTCTEEPENVTWCINDVKSQLDELCGGKSECEVPLNEGDFKPAVECGPPPYYLRVRYSCKL